jgi:hypothetical protein
MQSAGARLRLRVFPSAHVEQQLSRPVLRIGEFQLIDIRNGHAPTFAAWKISLNAWR